jgi:predicted nucleic acid-binding protein
MTAFVDTNVLIRHLTGDPPAMAARATEFLRSQHELYLTDLVVAETVDVLESFYRAPRDQIAVLMRSLVALPTMVTVDPALLLRAVEVYEFDRLDFAEAYLVACAESTGVATVASFETAIDRVTTVTRLAP